MRERPLRQSKAGVKFDKPSRKIDKPSRKIDKPSRKFGTGRLPSVVGELRFEFPSLSVRAANEDISQATNWQIHDFENHTLIVHLGGEMSELATELEGKFGSIGPATPGEIWSVPAERVYASYALGGNIQFAVLSLPKGLDDSVPRDIAHLAGVRDGSLHFQVNRLIGLAGSDNDVSRMEAESVSVSISNYIYSQYGRESAAFENRRFPNLSSHQSRLLREYIWENLGGQVKLNHLSTLVGMTEHHLLLAFRDVFGTTPAQYLITQRLRRAHWLLLYSQLDITTIALETGFASHSHFTSTFNQRFSCPPSHIRRPLLQFDSKDAVT